MKEKDPSKTKKLKIYRQKYSLPPDEKVKKIAKRIIKENYKVFEKLAK